MERPLQVPFIWLPKAAGQAGCLGVLCFYLLKESSVENRSVLKTSSFTNMIPESASETHSCRILGFPESCGTRPRFGFCSSMCRGEGTFWKQGPAPSAGQAPARDPVLPGCFLGCHQSPFWGRCFVAASRIGGLPKAQPAGPSCLIEVEDAPSHNSQCRVLSGVSRILSHPIPHFLPSLTFSSPLRQRCIQWPGCMCVCKSPKFNLPD